MIDTMNAGFDDRRLGCPQEVLRRQQLKQRRLSPHAEQAPARQPARGVDHQNAAPVNHPQSQHDRRGCRLLRALEQQSLLVQSRPRMHGNRLPVEPACSGLLDRGGTFDLRKRREDNPLRFRRDRRRHEIREPACVGLRQKCFGPRSEESSREMHDDPGAVDGRAAASRDRRDRLSRRVRSEPQADRRQAEYGDTSAAARGRSAAGDARAGCRDFRQRR